MLFTTAQARTVAAILRDAAQAEILPAFRNLGDGQIRAKSSAQDLVTDADEAAERAITAGLKRAFPGAAVIGEEACAADPTLLDRIGEADLTFVVDPIDGTKNFASGLPLFGTMASVLVRGEAVAGVIVDPLQDDAALVVRGEGAWTERFDGSRRQDMRVADPVPVEEMYGVVSWHLLPEPLRSTVPARLPRFAAAVSYRCAAHEYRLAATGGCHFLVYAKLMPWDHVAGWLMIREAGGHAERFDGSPYAPHLTTGGLICATDRDSVAAVREALLEA